MRHYTRCPACSEHAEQVKYVKTTEAVAFEGEGLVLVKVGACYVGKTFRVVVEAAREG